MNLKSQLRNLEQAIASWQLPPDPPVEELRKTAADFGLPLERVTAIWRRVTAISPEGMFGDALLLYLVELQKASKEYAATVLAKSHSDLIAS